MGLGETPVHCKSKMKLANEDIYIFVIKLTQVKTEHYKSMNVNINISKLVYKSSQNVPT